MSADAAETEGRESVLCPECSTPGTVALNRRESTDFCSTCDFPLFWTPSVVIRSQGDENGEGLRRLPGTGGRQTVAATPCPTCAEANPITNQFCLRCGSPMVLPLAPAPVVQPPAPIPAPVEIKEPEPKEFPWMWVALGAAGLVLITLLIILLVSN